MTATMCACMGPAPGETLCPCRLREMRERTGQREPLRLSEPTRGCICPPTSEQTCQSQFCPRKAIKGLTIGGGLHA